MALNLAEEFLLLAYNDVSGKPMVDGMKLNAALAGTAVVELALTGALELTDRGRLVRTGQQPADSRLAVVAELADGRKPKDAISRISGLSGWHNRAGDLREMLLADLAATGVLRLEEGRVLGVFRTTAWKPGDTAIESSLAGRVRSALLDGTPPDDRTAALISILHAIDLLPRLLPDADKRAIRRRGKEISESDWGAAAVRKAVQEV
jgi:Golgi phosphoprotein 3 (GPP34)